MSKLKALWPPLALAVFGLALCCAGYSLIGLLVYVFALLDINGRAKDYEYLSGFKSIPARLALHYGKSFCGRNVVVTIFPVYKHLYSAEGYRWYMILPDGFPKVALKLDFWRNIFFGHARGVRR